MAGSTAADAGYRPTPPSLQLAPCVIGGVAARCGSLAVPEDVISAFIDSASTLDLPTDCLAQLPIPPFALP